MSDVESAKKAELDRKKSLLGLRLVFNRWLRGKRRRKNEEDKRLLEALKPYPNLEELEINGYRGNTVFTSWMISLTNLRVLSLYRCINCEHLPPIGQLPSPESLEIADMRSVKRVGNEFLGINSDHNSSSSPSVIAFPKLKFLEIWVMNEWEDWKYGITGNGKIMPLLSSLKIRYCPKLKALPQHSLQLTALEKLEIACCPILWKCYRKIVGEDWLKISYIPHIRIQY